MKKLILAVAFVGSMILAYHYTGVYRQYMAEENEHSTWCESIYHRNISCPQHGRVTVPAEVLAEEAAETLAWCDSIYHQNVSCPKYGKVEVPPEVLKRQAAEHLAWCQRINYQNPSCQHVQT